MKLAAAWRKSERKTEAKWDKEIMNQGAYEKVKAYIDKYHMISQGDTVVAGVSGGADSVCLFVMLCGLMEEKGFRLAVVHVNHGIREEAGEDAAYVKELCGKHGIPFFLVQENVKAYAEEKHLSEEEAGREMRYRAFEGVLEKYGSSGKIAVAHNANDRAETMLFHLFRGTGLTGAAGIRPVRGNVIRPILCLGREEIEDYLRKKGMPFCIDRTNLEDTYTRNRIRSHILPFAEQQICTGAVGHMCEAADIFLETDEYIRRQAQKAYEGCILQTSEDRVALDIKGLMGEEAFIRKRVLIQCVETLMAGRKDIASVHIRELEELLQKPGSKELSLPYRWKARKEYGRLELFRDEAKEEEGVGRIPILLEGGVCQVEVPRLGIVGFSVMQKGKLPIFWRKPQIISEKTYTEWLDYDRITKALMFRTREPGDYLTINKELCRKKLKSYMIEEKIPKNKRGSLYVLAEGSHIIWVPGYRISEYYKITEQTKHILKVQLGGDLKCQKE